MINSIEILNWMHDYKQQTLMKNEKQLEPNLKIIQNVKVSTLLVLEKIEQVIQNHVSMM